jgi:hypothetical protein
METIFRSVMATGCYALGSNEVPGVKSNQAYSGIGKIDGIWGNQGVIIRLIKERAARQ